jgi:hypothetical protein
MSNELAVRNEQPLLSEELARLGCEAREAHDRVRQCAAEAVENMVGAGQALRKARDLCDTDQFDAFITTHFRGKLRTAQTYMKLARHWSALRAVAPPETLTSQRKALRLLDKLIAGEEAAPRRTRASRAAAEVAASPAGPTAAETTPPTTASTGLSYEGRRAALRRIYDQMQRLLDELTEDLAGLKPPHYLVEQALTAIARARVQNEQLGKKLFSVEG